MSHEDLQEAVRQKPFVPFRLMVSTGISFDIRHPDQLSVERRSAQVVVTEVQTGCRFIAR